MPRAHEHIVLVSSAKSQYNDDVQAFQCYAVMGIISNLHKPW
ncbi:1677_t:CDS:2 [Diversispora eburnea]|uniref:1677_t:CDS:1 n=1 Tax=Diversispora eburnea TaxID=1213867 RepID=A0A9N8W3F4_9GLOM|nr:1677_t:CDS:2 [Diversispora eburnea]